MNTKLRKIINLGLFLSLFFTCILFSFKSENSNIFLFGYSRNRIFLIGIAIILEIIVIIIYYLIIWKWGKVRNFFNKIFNNKNIYIILIFILIDVFIVINAIVYHLISQQIFPRYLIVQISPILGLVYLIVTELIIMIVSWRLEVLEGVNKIFSEIINFESISNYFLVILFLFTYYSAIIVIVTMILRFQYPFALEWMEGQSLIQVNRIINNLPLYSKPSIYYIPFIYTPLYFYISALFSNIFGLCFTVLRMISLFSTLGTSVLVFLLVNHERKNLLISIISSGLFLSLFKITGFWFDIARVDSLLLFLIFAGYYCLRLNSNKMLFISGILFSLAIYTKQTAIIAVIFILLHQLIKDKRHFIKLALVIFLTCTLLFILFEFSSHGWFSYIIFNKASTYSINFGDLLHLVLQILLPLKFILFPFFYYFFINIRRGNKKELFFYTMMIMGLFCLTTIHFLSGGYDNVLLPFYGGVTVIVCIGMVDLLDDLRKITNSYSIPLYAIVNLILIIFLVENTFLINKQIPSDRDLLIGKNLVLEIQDTKGEVYLSSSSYLNLYCKKQTYAHWISMMEFLGEFGGKPSNEGLKLLSDLKEMIKVKKFDLAILDVSGEKYGIDINNYYTLDHVLQSGFYPVTGSKTRPKYFFLPMK
jgi:hypothetical protein